MSKSASWELGPFRADSNPTGPDRPGFGYSPPKGFGSPTRAVMLSGEFWGKRGPPRTLHRLRT
jgi:hypothetical protein